MTRSAACLRPGLIRHSHTGGVAPGAESDGTGVRSRYPLQTTGPVEGFTMPAIGRRLRVPGVSPDPTVLVIHVSGPWPQSIDAWRRDIDRLSMALTETAQSAGSSRVIVAGDFNSTMDMCPFRVLLRDGYRDAGRALRRSRWTPSRSPDPNTEASWQTNSYRCEESQRVSQVVRNGIDDGPIHDIVVEGDRDVACRTNPGVEDRDGTRTGRVQQPGE